MKSSLGLSLLGVGRDDHGPGLGWVYPYLTQNFCLWIPGSQYPLSTCTWFLPGFLSTVMGTLTDPTQNCWAFYKMSWVNIIRWVLSEIIRSGFIITQIRSTPKKKEKEKENPQNTPIPKSVSAFLISALLCFVPLVPNPTALIPFPIWAALFPVPFPVSHSSLVSDFRW